MTKTLLVGWDAADWQVIDPLIEEGLMPTLASFIKGGVRANLATLKPVLSPLLWTSIATGQRAHVHGILGFMQNEGLAEKPVPVQANQRKVPAIWNILNAVNQTTNVVNWWPSYPVEKVKGAMVSNHVASVLPQEDFKSLNDAQVFPKGFTATAEELRIHPAELTPAHLAPFFPNHAWQDLAKDALVLNLTKILAKAASVQAIFTELLEKSPANFNAVYFEALDHVSHLAMKYHPPRLAEINAHDFEKYQNVITAAYRFHDMMLQRLLELAGPDTNVIIISDHGFEAGTQRTVDLPNLPAAPALEHRNLGVFAAKGPAFKKAQTVYGASLLDIAPTVLHLHGLPVGDDLPGKVLTDAFINENPISYIPSWQTVVGKVPFIAIDEQQSAAVVKQLEDLGYVDLPETNRAQAIENDQEYNRAVSLLDANFKEEAMAVVQALFAKDNSLRVHSLLADLYLRLGKYEDFEKLQESWPNDLAQHPYGQYLTGLNLLQKGETTEALAAFKNIEDKGLNSLALWLEIANAFLISGKLNLANDYYKKVLAQNPHYSAALTGLAEIAVQQLNFNEAVRFLERSLKLRFFQPHAHYLLSLSFFKEGFTVEAQQALQICLQQAPKHKKARLLEKQLLGDIAPTAKEETVIVSGFPRSGTSLLMQVLAQGGHLVKTDEIREADEHNQEGYYEYKPVKKLGSEANILGETAGQALKVVGPLLPYLPPDRPYAVIWLDRPILEVILSQEKMKSREEAQKLVQNFPFKLALDFESERERLLNWLQQQPQVRLKIMRYHDFLSQPENTLQELQEFIKSPLNLNAAFKAIKPELHHNKIG
jgi:predicted AlkP superfamily phosphohydrolase/phosphomutase/thioredoxin-like negative regulator of GroEL